MLRGRRERRQAGRRPPPLARKRADARQSAPHARTPAPEPPRARRFGSRRGSRRGIAATSVRRLLSRPGRDLAHPRSCWRILLGACGVGSATAPLPGSGRIHQSGRPVHPLKRMNMITKGHDYGYRADADDPPQNPLIRPDARWQLRVVGLPHEAVTGGDPEPVGTPLRRSPKDRRSLSVHAPDGEVRGVAGASVSTLVAAAPTNPQPPALGQPLRAHLPSKGVRWPQATGSNETKREKGSRAGRIITVGNGFHR
jgi:hypothetical protein